MQRKAYIGAPSSPGRINSEEVAREVINRTLPRQLSGHIVGISLSCRADKGRCPMGTRILRPESL